MVKGKTLVVGFDRRLYNRDRDRGYPSEMSTERKCDYINEGVAIYFENQVRLAELDQKHRKELRPLENKDESLDLKEMNSEKGIYELPDNYHSLIRQHAIVNKEGCGRRRISVHIMQSDDQNNMLTDPMWRPSYAWESTLSDESKNGLHVWHQGDFVIEQVIVDYYQKPTPVYTPSLKETGDFISTEDGKIEKDTDLELNLNTGRKIMDIAVLCALRDLGEINDFQAQLKKIINVAKL